MYQLTWQIIIRIPSKLSIVTHNTDERLICGWMKDCDSGVHTVVNLANSFNTDVGYSSETSRAASHPSSVAFKRRSFTNKSASQNYSSPTESLGSQTGHGDAIGCSQSPSPSPMDDYGRSGRPADPRRLSYKRYSPDNLMMYGFFKIKKKNRSNHKFEIMNFKF